MTTDGSVVGGAAGAAFLVGCKATKWVNGLEQQLSTGGVETQSSVAVFVADSGVIFGYAILSDGRVVLIRWDAGGNPEILEPPNGLSVVNLSSIDSQGNAAGGALAQQFSCIQQCNDPLCNRKPFVWTRSHLATRSPRASSRTVTIPMPTPSSCTPRSSRPTRSSSSSSSAAGASRRCRCASAAKIRPSF